MAKSNYVLLYGQVVRAPRVQMDNSSVLQRCTFPLRVLRRFTDDHRSQDYASPNIFSANGDIINKMIELAAGDMCLIKGVFTTMDINKKSICTCGHTTVKPGVVSFITPIYIHKCENLPNDMMFIKNKDDAIQRKGTDLLLENNEISNNVHLIGTLCREPEFYQKDDTGVMSCTFQIAVNRHFRIKEGTPEIRTDYPWVRVYGEKAKEAASVLSINSTVFIDGSIHTKVVKRTVKCEKCGEEIPYNEVVNEIRPYDIEYLHNCNLPDKSYAE